MGRWLSVLEEDHATNLEEIETFKAGIEVLAEVLVSDQSAIVKHQETIVLRVQIEVEMLPAGKEMHRRRVDLLYDTDAPPLDFRTGHLCASQIGLSV